MSPYPAVQEFSNTTVDRGIMKINYKSDLFHGYTMNQIFNFTLKLCRFCEETVNSQCLYYSNSLAPVYAHVELSR